jgi:hypothetical protein
LKNRYASLFPDGGAVDHANICDPIFIHIGQNADNTAILDKKKQEKASESTPTPKKECKEIIGAVIGLPIIQIEIQMVDTGAKVTIEALLDSDVMTCFINEKKVLSEVQSI